MPRLRITPRGAVTRQHPGDGRQFTVELDFLDGAIRVECDRGSQSALPVAGKTIAQVHARAVGLLGEPRASRAAARRAERDARPGAVRRRRPPARVGCRRGCAASRSVPLRGRGLQRVPLALPRQDLAEPLVLGQLRPRGDAFFGPRARRSIPAAFRHLPDRVTREAYSHEVISAGFWPGGSGFEEAAFYAYAYPTPVALRSSSVEPEAAFWHRDLREFLLPYAAVREAPNPDAELQRFLQSTFDAAAALLDWPGGLVIDETPSFRPPAGVIRSSPSKPALAYIAGMDFDPDLGPAGAQRSRAAALGAAAGGARCDAARHRRLGRCCVPCRLLGRIMRTVSTLGADGHARCWWCCSSRAWTPGSNSRCPRSACRSRWSRAARRACRWRPTVTIGCAPQINGHAANFLVDTGATLTAVSNETAGGSRARAARRPASRCACRPPTARSPRS